MDAIGATSRSAEIVGMRKFTEEEDEFILTHKGIITESEIARRLDRAQGVVAYRTSILAGGIHRRRGKYDSNLDDVPLNWDGQRAQYWLSQKW